MEENKNNRGLICCRGKSLEYYKNFLDTKFDFICLINEFHKFIRQDKDLLSFLKKKSKEGHLIQQVNIEAYGVDRFLLDEIEIKEIIIARLAYNGAHSAWRPRVNTSVFNHLGRTLQLQPDTLEPYIHHVKNSLGVAILNLIIDKKCNKIDIIGSDFYEADYFLSHKGPDWHLVATKEIQEKLKKGIDVLVGLFPEVNFNIYTYSSYRNNSTNCNIIVVD